VRQPAGGAGRLELPEQRPLVPEAGGAGGVVNGRLVSEHLLDVLQRRHLPDLLQRHRVLQDALRVPVAVLGRGGGRGGGRVGGREGGGGEDAHGAARAEQLDPGVVDHVEAGGALLGVLAERCDALDGGAAMKEWHD